MNWLRRWLRRRVSGDGLEARIGHRFRDRELLDRCLTHRSWSGQPENGRVESNERLEFLGDAVLDLCISHHLFERYPRKKEGELTKYKSIIVSGKYLVRLAEEIGLGDYLKLSESEERTGGRHRASILEDAFEALIGAVYLDGGLPAAEAFVGRHILDGLDLRQASRENRNYKSLLLELSQGRGLGTPSYEVVEELGPDHSKFFVVEVRVGERGVGRGTGNSKKKAEQAAAREGFKLLREEHPAGSPPPPAYDGEGAP